MQFVNRNMIVLGVVRQSLETQEILALGTISAEEGVALACLRVALLMHHHLTQVIHQLQHTPSLTL